MAAGGAWELRGLAERAGSLASSETTSAMVGAAGSLSSVMARGEEMWSRCGGLSIAPSKKEGESESLKSAPTLLGGPESPLEALLRRERESQLVALMEESLSRSREATEAAHRQARLSDWIAYRQRLATLAAGAPATASAAKMAPALRPLLQTRAAAELNDLEQEFARLVSLSLLG